MPSLWSENVLDGKKLYWRVDMDMDLSGQRNNWLPIKEETL